jgi:16S rRNA (uracil1498-N3)-methyltransferase
MQSLEAFTPLAVRPMQTQDVAVSLPRFFVPSLDADPVILRGDEARHAARVRRLKTGQRVSLFDQTGAEATGVIVGVARGEVAIRVEQRLAPPAPGGMQLTLAVCAPKGARAEWMIEKAAELGVAAIWPLSTQRSVVEPRDVKLEKWRRVAREANKQSGRSEIMAVEPLQDLEHVIGRFGEFSAVWLADRAGQACQSAASADSSGAELLLVGPEGGWTRDEQATMILAGAKMVRLSRHILRIETAAIAAAAIWSARQVGRDVGAE